MSKAEERALEKYPLLADDDKEGLEALKYVGMECECASVYNEVQESKQAHFIEGYHQAEKDVTDAFMEKAAEWLDETLRNTDFYENEIVLMVKEFKKAMKL